MGMIREPFLIAELESNIWLFILFCEYQESY